MKTQSCALAPHNQSCQELLHNSSTKVTGRVYTYIANTQSCREAEGLQSIWLKAENSITTCLVTHMEGLCQMLRLKTD